MYFMNEDPRTRKQQYYATLGKELKKKERAKKAEADHARAASGRTMTALEWFIIGIVMHPIVGPLYTLAIQHTEALIHR